MIIKKLETNHCPNCVAVKPVIEKFIKDTSYPLSTINLEDNPDVGSEYNVISVPTLLILDDYGVEVDRFTGQSAIEKGLKEFNHKKYE